jgi:hypothetical protein
MKRKTTLHRAAITLSALALIVGAAVAPEAAQASGEWGQHWEASVGCDTITRQISVTGNFMIAPGYNQQRVAWRVWIYNKTTRSGFYFTNPANPGSQWFVIDHNRVQYLYDPSWNSYSVSYNDIISTRDWTLPLAKGEYSVQVQYGWLSGYWVYSSFVPTTSYRQDQLYYSSTCRI